MGENWILGDNFDDYMRECENINTIEHEEIKTLSAETIMEKVEAIDTYFKRLQKATFFRTNFET